VLFQRTGDKEDRRKVYVSLSDFRQKDAADRFEDINKSIQRKLERPSPEDREQFFRGTLLDISQK
jgi:DNA-binding MarR family transcriptional regulator